MLNKFISYYYLNYLCVVGVVGEKIKYEYMMHSWYITIVRHANYIAWNRMLKTGAYSFILGANKMLLWALCESYSYYYWLTNYQNIHYTLTVSCSGAHPPHDQKDYINHKPIGRNGYNNNDTTEV